MNRVCESGKLDKIRVNLELVITHHMITSVKRAGATQRVGAVT